MSRRLRLLVVAATAPVLLIAFALLYLNFADLSGWRDPVARLASDAIGRELRISGEFQPEIGFATRVVATDLTLANADWSDQPYMVSVDRLAGEIDLLSLVFGPITIREVEISGARVLFEVDSDDRFNWSFGSGKPDTAGRDDVELVISHALVKDLQLVYLRRQDRVLGAVLTTLEVADDGTGMLDLDVVGSLEGAPLEISGRLGTFIGLINASQVEHDLSGRFADTGFSLRGTIDDLSSLSGVDAEASIGGPDLSQLMAGFGLAEAVDGPFEAEASVRPTAAGSAFNLDASLGEMTATVKATTDSILSPSAIDVAIDASGPNLAAIGAIAGLKDLPAEPFTASGRIQWSGFPLQCDNVKVRVGDNTLSAHGALGEPPLMLGTDFDFDGGGPDISAVVALVGLDMPRESYKVDGRLVRLEEALGIEGFRLEVGQVTLEVDGKIGDPPEYEGTALEFRGDGPNLARLQNLVGIDLPAEPFEVSGRLAQGEGAIDLEAVRARIGHNTAQISGQLSTETDYVGTDLHVQASGPDASQVTAVADLSAVPAEQFAVKGRVRFLANGYRVNDVVGRLGSLTLEANGLIAPPPTLVGSDIQIHIDDSDLSHLASVVGLADLPPDPVSIDARVQVEESGYRVTGLEVWVGELSAEIDGFVGLPPEFEGTDLQITAHGPRVGDLGPYLKQPHLPDAPFSVAGGLRIESAAFLLDKVVAEVENSRTVIDGTVMPGEGLAGTDLSFDFRGSDLGEIESLVAGFVELGELPRTAYSLTGGLTIDGAGFDLREIELNVGSSTARATGRLGMPPQLLGSDLTIDIDGPDAQLFATLTGVPVALGPLDIAGRIERDEAGFRFHDVSGRLGDYRAAVDGTLGELPKLIGTDLEIHASGPDPNLYEALAGLPDLPDKPFTLDGRFSGTPERFATRDFRLTFGASDLEGVFRIDITGKPAVEARLTSQILDFSRLRERLEDAGDAARGTTKASKKTGARGPLLIPDEPVALAWLQAVDADVAIRVEQLHLRTNSFRDLTVDVHLEDGRLEIDRATAAGRGEGRFTGSLLLEPHHETYRLETDISLRHIRLDPPDAVTELLERPPIDIDFDLEAVGATPHELATSTNGAVRLVIGKGIFDSSLLDLVTADILLTLLKALNPFAKEDPTTELQCGVALLSLDDGVARLEPMAFQSDKMTLLGEGKIDFRTEKLNLVWITKPRKGIGISASMLTNPYIKLGGTLSSPSLQLKEAEAVVSTGAAVATMGISLIAKGMFDRITAEKKVCERALEEIDRRLQSIPAEQN